MKDDDLILWHVSFEVVDNFDPRVPENRMAGEDDTTPRICMGTNIKRCITAMPDGGGALKGLLRASEFDSRMKPIIHAYCTIINRREDGLITPSELVSKYGVLDAKSNGEHWLTKSVTFEHRMFEIYDAKFSEATDQHGNRGYLIDDLDYDLIKTEPEWTFEKVWRCKHDLRHINIRQALKVMSEMQAV